MIALVAAYTWGPAKNIHMHMGTYCARAEYATGTQRVAFAIDDFNFRNVPSQQALVYGLVYIEYGYGIYG